MIKHLHDNGIVFLAQVSILNANAHLSQSWKFVTDLAIPSDFQQEWDTYIIGSNSCGLQLFEEEDTLFWSWNGKNGEVTS